MVGGVEDELANSLLPSSLFPSSWRTIGAGSARRCYGETAKNADPAPVPETGLPRAGRIVGLEASR